MEKMSDSEGRQTTVKNEVQQVQTDERKRLCQNCKFNKNKPSQCFNKRWEDAFPLFISRKYRCDHHEHK